MAGVLIYTAAPDSEGTLGGLVKLGEPDTLGATFEPPWKTPPSAPPTHCAERPGQRTASSLHAAACHACLFVPETSCERGNRYLDRSVLVRTVASDVRGLAEVPAEVA